MRCTSLLAKWCDDDNIKPYLRTGYGLILSAKKYSIEDDLGLGRLYKKSEHDAACQRDTKHDTLAN